MGMSSLKLLKYVLFIFNLLFWVCGCCILGFGIYLLVQNTYGVLFRNLPFLTLGNVLVIVGSIIMVVAFLGCMGSIKENKCLLMSFFVLLMIILLAEVALAILLFVYEQKLGNLVAEGLNDSIQHYHTDNSTMAAWDFIQSHLHCCGVNSSRDWTSGPPSSCPPGADVQVILLAIFLLLALLFKLNYIRNCSRKDLNLPPRNREFGKTTTAITKRAGKQHPVTIEASKI